MDNQQEEIIQSTQSQQPTKLAPNIPNPLKGEGITFENDFGKKPLGLAHLTKDQGFIIILSLAGAFVGAAVAGVPLFAVILAAGINDIKYAGGKNTQNQDGSDKPQPQIEQETIEVPATTVIDEQHTTSNSCTPEPDTIPQMVSIPAFQPPNALEVIQLPMRDRAIRILNLLSKSGFDVSSAIADQITCICGNQRGGKGTLMAILAILSSAIDPATKIHYFTAGDDIYPFKCKRLVCRLSYPGVDGDKADSMVAQALYEYLKEMDNQTQGACQDTILVIDEAVALSDYLDPEQKQWMIRFLLTRANKKGAQIFIVLHGSNLTSWVGTGNAGGFSSTFKTGATFIGCEATSKKINPLRSISVATGRYFIANPDDFSKPVANGDLGTVPEWLKTEINPATGQPDPARTLLTFFPELNHQDPVIPSPSIANTVETERQEETLNSKAKTTELKVSDSLAEPLHSIWLFAKKKGDWVTAKDVYNNGMAVLKGKNVKQIRQYMGLLADSGWGQIDEMDGDKLKSDSSVGFRAS